MSDQSRSIKTRLMYKDKIRSNYKGDCIAKDLFVHLIPTTKYCCLNCYYFDYQADLISVDGFGYVTEYEVKTSLVDFKRDFKKIISPDNERKVDLVCKGKYCNKFYYVIPDSIFKDCILDVLPNFGIITFSNISGKNFKQIIKTGFLHKSKYDIESHILKKSYSSYKKLLKYIG